jgi:hypothetical protein
MPFEPATGPQREAVRKVLPPEDWDKVAGLSFGDAVRVTGHDPQRWRKRNATPLQKKLLLEYGLYKIGMKRGEVSDQISRIKAALINPND